MEKHIQKKIAVIFKNGKVRYFRNCAVYVDRNRKEIEAFRIKEYKTVCGYDVVCVTTISAKDVIALPLIQGEKK